jgi:hypothetical protein
MVYPREGGKAERGRGSGGDQTRAFLSQDEEG